LVEIALFSVAMDPVARSESLILVIDHPDGMAADASDDVIDEVGWRGGGPEVAVVVAPFDDVVDG